MAVCAYSIFRPCNLRKSVNDGWSRPQGVDMQRPDTHSTLIGYLLWIFGFLGAHRFY